MTPATAKELPTTKALNARGRRNSNTTIVVILTVPNRKKLIKSFQTIETLPIKSESPSAAIENTNKTAIVNR